MCAFLLVENEDAIAVVFRAAVDEARLPVTVHRVSNGEEAMEYLHTDQQDPDVVFLDLNMPKVDGWEVLKAMKENESFCRIPIVIFSTSSQLRDKERAYSLGADQFLTKPSTFTRLVGEIETVYRRFVDGNANSAVSAGG